MNNNDFEPGRYRKPQAGNQWWDFVVEGATEGIDTKIIALVASMAQGLQDGHVSVEDCLDRLHRARGARRAILRMVLSKDPNNAAGD